MERPDEDLAELGGGFAWIGTEDGVKVGVDKQRERDRGNPRVPTDAAVATIVAATNVTATATAADYRKDVSAEGKDAVVGAGVLNVVVVVVVVGIIIVVVFFGISVGIGFRLLGLGLRLRLRPRNAFVAAIPPVSYAQRSVAFGQPIPGVILAARAPGRGTWLGERRN